ncbi:MAG: translation initiation factor IF-2 [Clostridiales bacterium]|nr:translation initiation factor IF-2 [Clostridiales bacterium]MDD6063568.1 translation initiation factor IF-2 [Clostridiales bacterium]MDD7487856.1 translation initiation factor IF-2 [Clostridiales bacterium]MDY2691205.1 translation initiation factor IF-2 [Oscillospiraceae bacterium]
MSIEIKQKIKEVADDFGMPAKNLIEIVGKFYDKPKSSSQNLTEEQLNVIFDYITAQNQIGSIAEVFAAAKPKDEPKPAAPAPAPQQSQPVQSQQPAPRPQQNQPRPQGSFNNNNNRPAQQQNQRPQFNQRPQPQNQQPRPQQSQPQQQAPQSQNAQNNAQQPAKQPQPERKRERRVIDTSAVTVNADRYDDRVDSLVSERVQNYSSGKQKIGNKNKKQQSKKFGTKNRSEEQEKMRRLQLEIAKKAPLVVKIPDEITVGELASRMKKTAAEVIKCLLKNGVMASVNQTIDYDTAEFVAVELGCKVEREVVVTIEEKLFDDHEDTADELVSRPPVIVVMGHVDHGKTSLLDYIRHAKVAAGEAGGITQHIGAYTVKVGDQPITFLDTPGHAAFTEMRARGAMCTDIAILVVAADDGIMPQTIEAINHAKAANIPIIVAVNKMDKHGANPDRILTQLTEHGLTPADWGGETEVCKISAKTGEGIDDLLETVLLTAEMLELKANPNRAGKGCVLEARLDKTRGPIATLLVQNGTLHQGDLIIAGTAVGRVRVMTNDKGLQVKDAGPSIPVEITGLTEVPAPGDEFNAVADERMARQLVEQRKQKIKDDANKLNQKVTLESLFSKLQEGEMKELNLIVKADVQGSAEAVKASLEKISNDEVRVKVIHAGVGAINESDILLASTSNAIVVGFNVRPNDQAQAAAKRDKVDVRMYRVIYDAINEISDAMKGMLAPKFREAIIGHAEVRQTYKVSAIGTIAGCYVKDGKITRDASVRVLRDNIVIHEGKLGSLQRFKDSVKEVAAGYECGMSIEKYNDIKEGDIFECFVMEQIKE